MPVTRYSSLDASAPVLDGQVGSLITVLDAVLVNGYGAKAAAGWTKPFTGTNGAVFRQAAGNQYYLNVNDNGPGAGAGREVRVVGYETMTAFATGTNLFPTAAQEANGKFVRKSATADATARGWKIFADDRTFYMGVLTTDTANAYRTWGFGDIYSLKTSDPGRAFICCSVGSENSSLEPTGGLAQQNTLGTASTAKHLARGVTGAPGAISFGMMGNQMLIASPTAANQTYVGVVAFKNNADNNIYISPVWAHGTDGGNHFRGRMRGLWHFGHGVANASDGDTITGTGTLAGKTFEVLKGAGSVTNMLLFETSDTWETN